MRYREFKLTEQQLDELKMSPRSLGAFAKSPLAKGIQAGFEAEIIFPGMGGADEDGDMEPDYDEDMRCTSIDGIIDFFNYDDFGYGMSSSEERKLRSSLDEAYWEYADEQMMSEFQDEQEDLIKAYIEEHDFDWDGEIREYLSNEDIEDIDYVIDVGQRNITNTDGSPEDNRRYTEAVQLYKEAQEAVAEYLDEKVAESIRTQDGTYDTVLEEFRNDFSWPEESEFLGDQNLRYMSDVQDQYGLSWPYMRLENEGDGSGFNEDNAQQLADDLSKRLGVTTKASSGYHSVRRDASTWIFEPDSSLDAGEGDMPVEIISPPMPLDECLNKLDEFFEWAGEYNAYSNKSTGFHMGVSLPEVGGKVDFVKLALFLGDEHVLQAFGRTAIGFCESAIKKIKNRVKNNPDNVTTALNFLRKSLLDVAHELVAGDEGFGKYTSINPKGNYIEFRSAGGTDYFKDIPKLKNMLLRYAQAMVVAADPQAERNEYYKKLYKLISPAGGNTSLDLFARYATGTISKEDLKQQWATATLEKEQPSGQPTKWEVFDQNTGKTLEIVDAATRGEAMDIAFDMGYTPNSYSVDARPAPAPEPKPNRRAELAKRIKGPPVPNYYIRNIETGEFVYLFTAKDNQEAVEFLEQYRSTHRGMFQYGLSKVLKPDEIAQAKKNTEADTSMQQSSPATSQSSTTNVTDNWEIVDPTNGAVVRRLTGTTFTGASHVADTENQSQGRNSTNQFIVRRVTQQAAPGQMTMSGQPVWEIYRRSEPQGAPIWTFVAATQSAARERAQEYARNNGWGDRMNELNLRVHPAHPAQQPEPRHPQQERSANGVPMWDIYQRSNGLSLHQFADHTQNLAWQTAQEWARQNSFELSDLSVRPVMPQA